MPERYVLIGGGIASARAAAQLRRLDQDAAITLVSQEAEAPYDHPPLSKEYLRGEWPRQRVLLHPARFYDEQGIALRLGVAAQALDLAERRVALADGAFLDYDKLLLAMGGRPRRLAVPGAELPGVRYLRTLGDAEAIRADALPGRRAVVIGAGFIGMELAASLTHLGVAVTVIEAAPTIWSRFLDQELAAYFQRYAEARGVTFRTGTAPLAIAGRRRAETVALDSGHELPCDFVCVGVGIQPSVELAEAAGLAVANGVVANEYLETSQPGVFAAGDVVNYYDPIFQKRRRVEHWGHAEYTGLLAAQNMAGEPRPYDLLSYVWSDIFDLHLEFAGEEREHDRVLLRGDLGDQAFTVLYLKEGVLRAYLGVNAPQREFITLQRMIRRRTDLSARLDRLRDPAQELRALL
ncbi:MAG: FAD-dependent oxidoreductase [Chloroflexi bacterium]|nr:FAD-dependent oxidoreductase [Chloroflexota bacterium]